MDEEAYKFLFYSNEPILYYGTLQLHSDRCGRALSPDFNTETKTNFFSSTYFSIFNRFGIVFKICHNHLRFSRTFFEIKDFKNLNFSWNVLKVFFKNSRIDDSCEHPSPDFSIVYQCTWFLSSDCNRSVKFGEKFAFGRKHYGNELSPEIVKNCVNTEKLIYFPSAIIMRDARLTLAYLRTIYNELTY